MDTSPSCDQLRHHRRSRPEQNEEDVKAVDAVLGNAAMKAIDEVLTGQDMGSLVFAL